MNVSINVTLNGQNGDFRCELDGDLPDDMILGMVREAIQGGNVTGIEPQPVPEEVADTFVIDRYPGNVEGVDTRFIVRPKTPFGV